MKARPTFVQRVRAALAVFSGTAPQLPTGAVPFSRTYGAARQSRTTTGFASGGNTSADAELASSLTRLRSASRQMIRDSAYAKRARTIIVNNVIGSGVGMQAQVMTTRGGLSDRVNADIEKAWAEWCDGQNCHTGGALHFHDLERAAMGQVFEAGEVIIRKRYAKFGDSRVPLGLELIEAERLADEFASPAALSSDADVRMGVEVDTFGRAVAYWIRERHPGDIRVRVGSPDRYERVPAADIFHLRIVDRWPQTRGEPWMHTVLRKIDEMNEYTGSEVSAARAASYFFATIKTPDGDSALPNSEEGEDDKQVMAIEPLTIQELNPGEELDFHQPNRPNSALDPFLRYMLREVAAGVGTSYESLSRDYSQSNYSSSRLALMDDRDLYKMLQQWWIRSFRRPLHRAWLQQAVLGKAIASVQATQYAQDPSVFEAVLFKPRGWSWIDPTKEVTAYKEAIKAGLTTLTDVIAQTADGRDIEDVVATRRRELDMLEAADIEVDTTVVDPLDMAAAKTPTPKGPPADDPAAEPADRNAPRPLRPVPEKGLMQ